MATQQSDGRESTSKRCSNSTVGRGCSSRAGGSNQERSLVSQRHIVGSLGERLGDVCGGRCVLSVPPEALLTHLMPVTRLYVVCCWAYWYDRYADTAQTGQQAFEQGVIRSAAQMDCLTDR